MVDFTQNEMGELDRRQQLIRRLPKVPAHVPMPVPFQALRDGFELLVDLVDACTRHVGPMPAQQELMPYFSEMNFYQVLQDVYRATEEAAGFSTAFYCRSLSSNTLKDVHAVGKRLHEQLEVTTYLREDSSAKDSPLAIEWDRLKQTNAKFDDAIKRWKDEAQKPQLDIAHFLEKGKTRSLNRINPA